MNTAAARTPRPLPSRHGWAGLALALALPLMVALWGAVALWLDAPAAWMAVIVAADASVLLSLLRVPAGRGRAAWAVAFLALATAASLWLMAAGVVGPAFGLLPWESALRLGPVLFGVIAEPWMGLGNLAWLAAAVALTLWWNR
ncbi:MAG: hypothetical protein ACK508_00610 [Lysobacteraceae bacterium]